MDTQTELLSLRQRKALICRTRFSSATSRKTLAAGETKNLWKLDYFLERKTWSDHSTEGWAKSEYQSGPDRIVEINVSLTQSELTVTREA